MQPVFPIAAKKIRPDRTGRIFFYAPGWSDQPDGVGPGLAALKVIALDAQVLFIAPEFAAYLGEGMLRVLSHSAVDLRTSPLA